MEYTQIELQRLAVVISDREAGKEDKRRAGVIRWGIRVRPDGADILVRWRVQEGSVYVERTAEEVLP